MASNGKFVRLSTLSLLYFVQGSPYGFQTGCLPLILRDSGLSFTALGAMKLLFLPWVLKPLYATFMERTRSKKWWLTFSMGSLAITCFMASLFSTSKDLMLVSLLMFSLNLFSATQDVSTDSLAVMVLPESELGLGNTIQVVAYKAGSVFAGGLLLYCENAFGWSWMFVIFGSVYVISLILLRSFSLVERSSSHLPPTKESTKSSDSKLSEIVESIMNVPGTRYMIGFVLFYKLCERAEQTFSLYMVDKHVPRLTMAFWSTVMKTFSLAGSSYGGYVSVMDKKQKLLVSSSSLLLRYSLLRSFLIFAQLCILNLWGTDPIANPEKTLSSFNRDSILMYSGFVCTSLTLFCAGVITTAVFTLMMRLSQSAPKSIQGTHFTSLATAEVLGKLLFATVSGGLTDQFGLHAMYLVFLILALLCVPLINYMPTSIYNKNL